MNLIKAEEKHETDYFDRWGFGNGGIDLGPNAFGTRIPGTASTSQKAITKPGSVTSVHLNLTSGEGLKEAFEGVDRAFFCLQRGMRSNTRCSHL